MNQPETVSDRIQWIVDHHYEGVYSRLATAIGVDPATIKANLEGGSKPSWKVLEGILRVHPNCSSEWLMRGHGDPCLDVNSNITELQKKYSHLRGKVKEFEEWFRSTKFDL